MQAPHCADNIDLQTAECRRRAICWYHRQSAT